MLISLIPTHIYLFALQKCAGRTIFSSLSHTRPASFTVLFMH